MDTDKDPLIGLRVQIIIDEDGAPDPPALPSGIITAKGPVHMHDGEKIVEYMVQLDKPVRYVRYIMPSKSRDWILSDLKIEARYRRRPLDLLLAKNPVPPNDAVTVMITNRSTGDYFAIGTVRKA